MIIYPSTKVKPYVYCCIHRLTGEVYYGSRSGNVKLNRPSHIDFPLYRTSSKIVRPIFDQFDWIILAEFNDVADAILIEQQLISENWQNPLLLNQMCHLAFDNKLQWPGCREPIPKPPKIPKIPSWMKPLPPSSTPRSTKPRGRRPKIKYNKVVTDILWESHGDQLSADRFD